ncbi:hypothetical protein [Streptomyces sp. NPDC090445]|uniref:hypothetical protein n=1 Tax=Streptomyces sp. NPDC090445 TaxID=3365963 RepID=UPI0038125E28
MNRIKLVAAGVVAAACVTAVASSSASAAPSVKNETTAAAFQSVADQPENVVSADVVGVEPRGLWGSLAKQVAQGVVGNAVYEGAKYVAKHPVKAQEKMFRRGGVPTTSEVGAAEMSRVFD